MGVFCCHYLGKYVKDAYYRLAGSFVHTSSFTHICIHTHTPHTHSLSLSPSYTHPHTHSLSLARSLSLSLMYAHTHTHTYSHAQFQQIVKILNAHTDSLGWIDRETALLRQKVDDVAKVTEYRKREQERSFRLVS